MRNYYIFKSGRISRKDNSILFKYKENDQNKKIPIPVNDIDSLYCFGEIDFNTKLINFFSKNNVMLHFFNYYGYYTGTYYPKEFLNSGEVIVKQVEHYLNMEKRYILAKEFINGAYFGIIKNLKRYQQEKQELTEIMGKVENIWSNQDKVNDIQGLMGLEGNIRENYYKSFNIIINQDINFRKRVMRPPDNMINCLISFLNSMVYTSVLKEIYMTQLNPTISYLHTPGVRRFSLALDLAEIFKPIFTDRIIFRVLNRNEIDKDDFDKKLNYIHLKEKGRKKLCTLFDERMKKTIYHKQLKKKVAYRTLIRLECYKLIKHLFEEKSYNAFKMWW